MLSPPPIIQLWSDKDESAFAVRLSTDQQDSFRAIVAMNHDDSNSGKFTKIADEMYYDESFHYDWPFMLERWIEAWKSGFRHSPSIPALLRWNDAVTSSGKGISSSFSSKGSRSSGSSSVAAALLSAEPDIITYITTTKGQERKNSSRNNNTKRQKPSLKCHFCNLMFHEAAKRSAHEETWHANKLLLKSSSSNNSLTNGQNQQQEVRNDDR